MTVKIVSNEQELNDAYQVRRVVFVEEQQVPEELEIDEFEGDSTHFVVYSEGDQQPIGAGRFRVLDGIGKIERICILQSERGKGTGARLMEAIETHASERGLEKVKLNAQTHAEPFYTKLGYDTVSDIFMDAGIPHVTMTKYVK